jgi:putative glutamine amidotransferase
VIVKRPVIGITVSLLEERFYRLHRDNSDSVFSAGGLAVMLPYSKTEIREIADRVDGLLLSGGGDIVPHWFEEEPLPGLGELTPERDQTEIQLVKEMLNRDKPILAICRGCQILNIAAGGDMYQDLYSQRNNLLQHMQQAPRSHASHTVEVSPGSLLHRVTGMDSFRVNSFHHQAIRQPARGFVISARSRDGVAEAVESEQHAFVLGVQWHPENMTATDPLAKKLFTSFVEACTQ